MIHVNIRNDGTGDSVTGNYDVDVHLPGEVVVTRVEGFDRGRGFVELLDEIVKQLKTGRVIV